MTHDVPDEDRFREAYQGQAPWDIGHPQPAFVSVAGRVEGSILDAGCGTGENALFFAQEGHVVYGIDFIEEPILRARAKAAARELDACFLVMNALALSELPMQFNNMLDCGLFHVFSDDDRRAYVESLAGVLKPSGRLWLMCFSDKEPPGDGPRRVSERELRDAFSAGWEIESLEDARFETSPHREDLRFSEGGPRAYFMIARRTP